MSNLRLSFEQDGQVARVTLAAPKANILDQAMMTALDAAFEDLRNRPQLKVMILTSEGPHFSFGASVQEHLPEQVRTMLPQFSRLLGQMLELPAVTIAAVRGQCLGGGFELALACDFIVAEEGAAFACPEIKLAVFPPAAAVLLPVRIGASRAAELVLTGAAWNAAQAAAAGLSRANRAARTTGNDGRNVDPRPLSGPFAGRSPVCRARCPPPAAAGAAGGPAAIGAHVPGRTHGGVRRRGRTPRLHGKT